MGEEETKLPNGQVHTVESEQFANALMFLYEKDKPTPLPCEGENIKDHNKESTITKTSGYETYEPDVRSN